MTAFEQLLKDLKALSINKSEQGTRFEKLIKQFPVADISFHEPETGLVHNRFQRFKVSGVGEIIKAYKTVLWVFPEFVEEEVASDKTSAACDENSHHFVLHA